MLIALAPIMVSAAQLPMELPTVSSNYSPDSIENYEYRGKKLFPSPVRDLIFLNNDDANIQFNLITDDEYDLTVILSEQGIKDAQKEFNMKSESTVVKR